VETVMAGLHLDRRLSPRVSGTRCHPGILAYLRAGIGFGGSCLPKDVNALRVYGKSIGAATPMLDAAMAINAARPLRVIELAEAQLGDLAGKTIALLGLAFKAGTDDLRSSPAMVLANAFRARGAQVRAYDPCVTPSAAMRAGLDDFRDSIECATRDCDAAVITTADPVFVRTDWERVTAGMRMPVIIDGRNALRNLPLPSAVRYSPIGQGLQLAELARMAD
jgi:UDPglucose 6-dehydrogenase/GDP-mannose 6-dehydrogenase